MSVSRGRRSRESRTSPSKSRKTTTKIDADRRKFLRKLLRVLEELMDEKRHIKDDDEATESIAEETDSESEAEKTKDGKAADARGKSPLSRLGQGAKGNEKTGPHDEIKNVSRFRKLCENHGQLTYQIQRSLDALGGGGRTAKALSRMHEEVNRINDLFYVNNEKSDSLSPDACTKSLNACKDAALEVIAAFKELGVFNKSFFDTLERILKQLEIIAVKIDVEYGSYYECRVDRYLDSVFEPLIVSFESFLHGLTNIAEKEIAAIRLSQDFSSQRYLNLTTVATFLSSVTATTLQITADDSGSPLTSVTNTLWFISLVFSTASAVYSLLVMTWRQSSVCQPNLALPLYLNVWFRNGPMYTLIAAVMTFSIGLCLLAFHVADQQGGLASAAVPTAFAGIHAYAIFLFSAWFLLEQWKARHKDSWVKVRDGYLIPIAKISERHVNKLQNCGHRIKLGFAQFAATFKDRRPLFRRHRPSSPASVVEKVNDIESGRNASPSPVVDHSVEPTELPLISVSDQASELHGTPEAAELDSALAIPGTEPPAQESGSGANEAEGDQLTEETKYEPFENVLQFSPDGRFLASAYSDTVVIFDVDKAFSILCTIKAPDADQVRQIAWDPSAFYHHTPFDRGERGELKGELLVRSVGGVSTWNIRFSPPDIYMVGHFKETVGPAHWVGVDDAGTVGFVSTTETTIKLFYENCKEIRSIDVSKMRKINRIIDALFFRDKYIFCLADVPDDSRCDCLLVINSTNNTIESTRPMYSGHTFMIVSPSAKKILFHGSEDGVEIAEFSITSSDDTFSLAIAEEYRLWMRTYGSHELSRPEEAVVFHGNDDKMIVGYSASEIVALYEPHQDNFRMALHIYTTPTAEANPQDPVAFAVSPGSKSEPYLFAFRDKRGSVTVWSVQSNRELLNCAPAGSFELHDRRGAHSEDPVVTTGRFLTLPPSAEGPSTTSGGS